MLPTIVEDDGDRVVLVVERGKEGRVCAGGGGREVDGRGGRGGLGERGFSEWSLFYGLRR